MKNPYNRFAKTLIVYFGILEIAHLTALVWAGIIFIRTGLIGFPAPAPIGGWTTQAQYFLLANGIIDLINTFIAFVFVITYFRGKSWCWWLGVICMALSTYSAVLYIIGTGTAGAWQAQPIGYLIVSIVFVPMVFLGLLMGYWIVSGKIRITS
jgi:hypothetical protein